MVQELTRDRPAAPEGEPTLIATAVAFVERRLAPLPDLLRRAEQKWERSPEHVHRLRVATRRADAALAAFRPLFRPGRLKKMRRCLRDVRRAARDPRECDVHVAMLEARDDHTAAIADAIRLIRKDRTAAQRALVRVASRHPRQKMERHLRRLLATASAGGDETLARFGAGHLAARAGATRDAAGRDLAVPSNLHRMRLCVKKLRYAIEIFGPYSRLGLRETLVPLVKEAGDRLGRINDAHDLAERLSRYSRNGKSADAAGLSSLAGEYRADGETHYLAFLAWWQEADASGALERLEGAGQFEGDAE